MLIAAGLATVIAAELPAPSTFRDLVLFVMQNLAGVLIDQDFKVHA